MDIIEFLSNKENTMFLREPAEYLTIIISLLGMFVTLRHFQFLSRSNKKISNRIRTVFATDTLVYLITLLMGVGLYMNWGLLVHYDVIVRPLVLLLNVIAGWRLLVHFRSL